MERFDRLHSSQLTDAAENSNNNNDEIGLRHKNKE